MWVDNGHNLWCQRSKIFNYALVGVEELGKMEEEDNTKHAMKHTTQLNTTYGLP